MNVNETMGTTRRQLSELFAMAGQGARLEKTILAAAISRLESIESKLGEISRVESMSDDKAAQKYQELLLERGLLNQVISRARTAAGGSH